MKGASPTKIWADDELMALDSGDGRKHELWNGHAVLPGFRFATGRLFASSALLR
jgi:hypothetical protein